MKTDREERFRGVVGRTGGALAAGFGLVALLGWVLKLPLLSSFGLSLIPMAPSTALLFVLFGVTLFFQNQRASRRVGALIGGLGTLVSLTLLGLASQGIYLPAEHLGFQIVGTLNGTPLGHMSPLTAVLFFLASLAFLILLSASSNHPRRARAALGLTGLLILGSYLLILAYFAGLPLLYSGMAIPPALPTSLAFLALGLSLWGCIWENGQLPGAERGKSFTSVPASIILIFALLVGSFVTFGYLYYRNFEQQFRAQFENQLSAIAALKADELSNWRTERLSDANLFYQNKNFSGQVQAYLENPQAAEAQAGLLAYLEKVAAFPEYDRVFLLDLQGREKISIPATPDPDAVSAQMVEYAQTSLASNQVLFLDFHRHAEASPIHLSLLVPIFNPQDHRPLGILVLRINPQHYLYPQIQRWPVPSASAETLLVHREGEQVVYLNQPRFSQEAALSLRFPLTETNLPAVRAVRGETGIFEGLDYRGETVIADLRAVPDSPWFLISKMDNAEVYAPLRERLWQTLLFFGILTLAAGAGLVLALRQQQVRLYRAQVETLNVLRVSEEKFRLAFETSPDAVAITRLSDGTFVSVNQGFEQISGYTREAVVGKTSAEINIWKEPEDRRKVVEGLRANGEVRNYEAFFLTREGEIYGLMSAAIIELNGEPHILNITRDITERKQAETALRESEERFRHAVLGAPFPIMIHAENGEVVTINTPWTELTGYQHSEIPTIADWTQKAYGMRMDLVRADIDGLYALNGPKTEGEYTIMTRSGEARIWDFSSAPIGQLPDGRRMVISIAMDVTERKQIEKTLQQQNKYLFALQETELELVSQLNLDVLLENIVKRAGDLMETDSGYLDLVDAQTGQLLPRIGLGALMESLQHPSQLGEGVAGTVWQTCEPLVVNDYDHWSGRIGNYTRGVLSAVIGVPLLSGGQILGVLGLGYKFATQRTFEPEAVDILAQFARLAALAIENARLFRSYQQELADRQRAEEALRETNDYLDNLFNYANAPIIVWDPQFRITRFNHAFEALTGRSAAEMLGKPLKILFPPAQVKASIKHIQKTLMGERWEVIEIGIQHLDGSIRTVLWNSATLFSADGKTPIATIAQGQDITARKQAEEAVVASQRFLQDFTDNSTSLIYSLDTQGRFLLINRCLESVLGVPRETLIGKTREVILPPEIAAAHWANDLKVIHDRQSIAMEEENIEPDGKHIYFSVKFPLLDSQGAIQGIGGISTDITERKRIEQELKAYSEGLEARVLERTRELRETQEQLVRQERLATLGQLAGSIGHELRNPLGVISNAIYFLKLSQPEASDKIKEYLEIIEKETRTSDKIVTDLLDFTRIKSLARKPVSVADLVDQTLERYATPPAVQVLLEIPSDLPEIFADPQHIVQVLGNLIINAFQSMAAGPMEQTKLRISAITQDDMIKLAVQDTGVGIAPENLSKLFEPLFTTKTKGIGLGLAVSKKLTEANGGKIEVESRLGQGSTFTIHLPIYKSAPVSKQDQESK